MTCSNYTSKICSSCKTDKPLSGFNKKNSNKDGLRHSCKSCDKEYAIAYKMTKKGLITKIYSTQRNKSRKRQHTLPDYSLIELREWAFSQSIFHELYDKWVASGYLKKEILSFDRLDDYKPYTFDNLQIITWQDNNEKGHTDRKNGINNKHSKVVIQMDLNGEFIKKYYSLRHAGRVLGIAQANITKCCKGRIKTCGGFKWQYA